MESAIRPQPIATTRNQSYEQVTRAVGLAALAMIAVALVMVFAIAPRAQDEAGGEAQRIFYFHLSSAWVGFGAWLVTAFCGIRYLQTRNLQWDRRAHASAEIGVLFITLVLLSGMLWARPTWNAWWTWDFKLTLSALQFLMYVAYLMLRNGIENPEQRARFAAVYGIVGALTVPLNFLVSRVLESIHPCIFGPCDNSSSKGPRGLASEMYPILLFSIATFTLIYVYLLRTRIKLIEREDAITAKRAELIQGE